MGEVNDPYLGNWMCSSLNTISEVNWPFYEELDVRRDPPIFPASAVISSVFLSFSMESGGISRGFTVVDTGVVTLARDQLKCPLKYSGRRWSPLFAMNKFPICVAYRCTDWSSPLTGVACIFAQSLLFPWRSCCFLFSATWIHQFSLSFLRDFADAILDAYSSGLFLL